MVIGVKQGIPWAKGATWRPLHGQNTAQREDTEADRWRTDPLTWKNADRNACIEKYGHIPPPTATTPTHSHGAVELDRVNAGNEGARDGGRAVALDDGLVQQCADCGQLCERIRGLTLEADSVWMGLLRADAKVKVGNM